jgi:hypothetical protein
LAFGVTSVQQPEVPLKKQSSYLINGIGFGQQSHSKQQELIEMKKQGQ